MKSLYAFLIIALFSSLGYSNITADNEYILNHAGSAQFKSQLGTLMNQTSNLLIGKYSFAVQGGSTANSVYLLTNLNVPNSYALLPNKAIIKNVWIDVLTTVASSGSATVSVGAVSAIDLLAATAKGTIPVAGGRLQGIPAGTTTTFIKLSAAKKVLANVGTAALTAGKFNVYIEYVVGD